MKDVKILHKRGVRAPLPDDIDLGEVAVNTVAGELYVKTDGGDVVAIGAAQSDCGNQNIDGGHAGSSYLPDQIINGGSA